MEDRTPVGSTSVCTLSATIRGRVQNVGFRAFVYDIAGSLGLWGYTRNDFDGSVRVVACGQRARLEILLTQMKRGPIAARVDHVDVDWSDGETAGLPSRFEVRA